MIYYDDISCSFLLKTGGEFTVLSIWNVFLNSYISH